ncbi:MAG TPA: glycosyltransferase family 39 protein, partial [Sumerlaeia bacterium]|nr:glycosyltransferase family 39 protein [Sumerlaeia bacterium]
EAYYWLWGQYPAAGYYDHPPMVGWMSALFLGWAPGSELAARSAPIVLGAVSSLAIYAMVRDMFQGGRIAWRAAAICTITPMLNLNGVLIQPDNSLVLFAVLTWWLFWRASEQGVETGRPAGAAVWLCAGGAAGLTLLSKFHAWVLLPPLWGFLALSPRHRPLLRTPGPWLAAAAALAVVSPDLWWNARHEWVNYAFQWRRSGLGEVRFGLENVLLFALAPALMLSPLLYVAMLAAAWRGFGIWRRTGDSALLYLLCAGLPLPLFLGALSPFVSISAHWPAAGFIPLLALTVVHFEKNGSTRRRFYRASVAVCVATTVCAGVGPFLVRALPHSLSLPFRPELVNTGRLRREYVGWREIGTKAREMRDALERDSGTPTAIMADGWHLSSMLAFYSGQPREVFALEEGPAHNFAIWMSERGGLKGCNAVVVEKSKPQKHSPIGLKVRRRREQLQTQFERVEAAPSLIIHPDGSVSEFSGENITVPRLREFLIFRCYGFSGELAHDS